ncbi:MAG: hypothetical protein R2911_15100 [Caldilineaceae bacterium]
MALTATDDVIVTVDPAPPTNQAPGQRRRRPDHHLARRCHAQRHGQRRWTAIRHAGHHLDVVSGPGSVTFGDAALLNTSASFSVDGVYTLPRRRRRRHRQR